MQNQKTYNEWKEEFNKPKEGRKIGKTEAEIRYELSKYGHPNKTLKRVVANSKRVYHKLEPFIQVLAKAGERSAYQTPFSHMKHKKY